MLVKMTTTVLFQMFIVEMSLCNQIILSLPLMLILMLFCSANNKLLISLVILYPNLQNNTLSIYLTRLYIFVIC